MASTKFKRRDLNRFRKTYPYIRRSPRFSYVSDRPTTIEVGAIPFNNSSSESHTFTEMFDGDPIITCIAFDEHGNHSADVNVFVTSSNTASFSVETSQAFTGTIHFHAIHVG